MTGNTIENTMQVTTALLLSLALLSPNSNATQAIDEGVPKPQWQKVGEAQMSWLFFDIYSAKLFTAAQSDVAQSAQLAIELNYQRDISKSQLLKATRKELVRLSQKSQDLNITPVRIEQWLLSLQSIWPDVQQNDSIRFEVRPTGQGLFYFNDKLIGSISDRDFSNAFLALWISPNCSYPKLCAQLRGNLNA